MIYAVKGNKQYTILEAEKETYKKSGYDIYEEKNKKTIKTEDALNKKVSIAELDLEKAKVFEAEKTIIDLEKSLKLADETITELNKKLKDVK